MRTIKIWNRIEASEENERVYGEFWLELIYGTKIGRWISDFFLPKKQLSVLAGWYQSSRISKSKIKTFIQEYKINMKDFETKNYSSFNDFFIRKFRPESRSFIADPNVLPAFSEGRYFGYASVSETNSLPVKKSLLSAEQLLSNSTHTRLFKNGPVLIARLCPTDYHRFHFPDDGRILYQYKIPGQLHSVNPVALNAKNGILETNSREVSILETNNFGKIAYVEVGAFFVGKIHQTHRHDLPFKRGNEKGYFLFGGSTVILLGEHGKWQPLVDILEKTKLGIETFVQLGTAVGTSENH